MRAFLAIEALLSTSIVRTHAIRGEQIVASHTIFAAYGVCMRGNLVKLGGLKEDSGREVEIKHTL